MSGSHSRYSHQRDKLYSEVNLLQGAMVTDADQREAQDLAGRNAQKQSDMALGSGVPLENGVLVYENAAGPADVVSVVGLKPGRVVADGVWGEVRLAEGQTLALPPALDLLAKQAGYLSGSAVPNNAGYVIFADIWDRHAGPAEDARMVDSAFLGAHTSVRKERMAQIKLLPVDVADEGHRVRIEAGLPAFGDLRLTKAELTDQTLAGDECDPCATVIDPDEEGANHLFRFEIHHSPFAGPEIVGGNLICRDPIAAGLSGKVLVKFSRDNGSIEVTGGNVAQLIADPAFSNSVFEIAGTESEQQLGVISIPGKTRQAEIVDLAGLQAMPAGSLDQKIVRVWDGAVWLDMEQANLAPESVGTNGISGSKTFAGSTWTLELKVLDLDLEFRATIADGTAPFILPGDAYGVDIREFADESGKNVAFQAEPVEVFHRFIYLGQIRNKEFETETSQSDMRSRRFPAATALNAQQIAWSNHHHTDVDANTVQGAIDLLWQRDIGGQCLCTFCIQEGEDLGEQLQKILGRLLELEEDKPGRKLNSVLICFPRGLFLLKRKIEFSRQGHVTLRGAGREATEIHLEDASALSIVASEGVAVEDLSILASGEVANANLSVSGVETVSLSRCLFSGPKGDAGEAVTPPLVDIQAESKGGEPGAWVTECIFGVLEHRLGLRIAGGGSQIVRDCQFIGSPPKHSNRIIGLVPKVLKTVKFETRPPGIRPGRESGFFEVEGVSDRVYDMTGVPIADREAVIDLIRSSQRILGQASPRNVDEWNSAVKAINEITLNVVGSDAGDDGALRAVPGGTGINLARNDIDAFRSNLEAFANTVRIAVFQRKFGILVETTPRTNTDILGNRFKWVHSAILVNGVHDSTATGFFPVTAEVTVSHNVIQRMPILNQTKAKFGDGFFPAAITCTDVGYLEISHNTIQQLVTSTGSHQEYFGNYLVKGALNDNNEGFAAIEVRGGIGPVLHATCNDAVYFLHSVYLKGQPQWKGGKEENFRLRNNVWTFRRNTALPVGMRTTAVEFAQDPDSIAGDGHVRLIPFHTEDDNHPPNELLRG